MPGRVEEYKPPALFGLLLLYRDEAPHGEFQDEANPPPGLLLIIALFMPVLGTIEEPAEPAAAEGAVFPFMVVSSAVVLLIFPAPLTLLIGREEPSL